MTGSDAWRQVCVCACVYVKWLVGWLVYRWGLMSLSISGPTCTKHLNLRCSLPFIFLLVKIVDFNHTQRLTLKNYKNK